MSKLFIFIMDSFPRVLKVIRVVEEKEEDQVSRIILGIGVGLYDPHRSPDEPIILIFELDLSFSHIYLCTKFQVPKFSLKRVIVLTDGRTDVVVMI
jgi:hypothetical protein